MKNYALVIILLGWLSGQCSAQSGLGALPIFGKASKPNVKSLNVTSSDSSWTFRIHGYNVAAVSNSSDVFGHAEVQFTNSTGVQKKFELSYALFGIYFGEVFTFDVDQNGLDDLFITSYQVGTSGIGANAPMIAAFLFYPDSSIHLIEMSSFCGDVDLFRDINGDGKFEFACIRYLDAADGMQERAYYAVNIFAVKDRDFVNVSGLTPGYPLLLQDSDSGMHIVKPVPTRFRDKLGQRYPTVW